MGDAGQPGHVDHQRPAGLAAGCLLHPAASLRLAAGLDGPSLANIVDHSTVRLRLVRPALPVRPASYILAAKVRAACAAVRAILTVRTRSATCLKKIGTPY